jgi:hypothetical protein
VLIYGTGDEYLKHLRGVTAGFKNNTEYDAVRKQFKICHV